MVINVSKKYLPWMAKGFADPRVKVHIGDGCAYMKERPGEFDVIIVDSSDPIGKSLILLVLPPSYPSPLLSHSIDNTTISNPYYSIIIIVIIIINIDNRSSGDPLSTTLLPIHEGRSSPQWYRLYPSRVSMDSLEIHQGPPRIRQ